MANTFFNRSVDEVLKQQESSLGGLSHAQAADRLERFGPNALVAVSYTHLDVYKRQV